LRHHKGREAVLPSKRVEGRGYLAFPSSYKTFYIMFGIIMGIKWCDSIIGNHCCQQQKTWC